MIDPIVTEGDPVLRLKAKEVPKAMFKSKELADIIARMSASLHATPHGVAIAAPQIGISYRIFVVAGFAAAGVGRHDEGAMEIPDVAFINPVITKRSRKKIAIDGEGCLSVPHIYGTIKRSEKATVRAYDVNGAKFERGGSELMAEIFEHECDHLDGILFIDKATNIHEEVPESPLRGD